MKALTLILAFALSFSLIMATDAKRMRGAARKVENRNNEKKRACCNQQFSKNDTTKRSKNTFSYFDSILIPVTAL
ncbi:MAG: hypothetical protein K2X48_09880 [Chitinophagaceae bacterium]|nr:hypothetical protein [Chitinophagaceae bacterium]